MSEISMGKINSFGSGEASKEGFYEKNKRGIHAAIAGVVAVFASGTFKLPESIKEKLPDQVAYMAEIQSAEAQNFDRNKFLFNYCQNLGTGWYQSGSGCVGPNGRTAFPLDSYNNNNSGLSTPGSGTVFIHPETGEVCTVGSRVSVRKRIIPNKTTVISTPQVNCGEARPLGRDDD
jgi:hypothetical protein